MATTPLTEAQITQALTTLEGWQQEGDTLLREFKFGHYMAGIAFAGAVGTIAEAFDHHPDMHIGYKKVVVKFTTHDAGNKISQKDVDCARAINALGYPKA